MIDSSIHYYFSSKKKNDRPRDHQPRAINNLITTKTLEFTSNPRYACHTFHALGHFPPFAWGGIIRRPGDFFCSFNILWIFFQAPMHAWMRFFCMTIIECSWSFNTISFYLVIAMCHDLMYVLFSCGIILIIWCASIVLFHFLDMIRWVNDSKITYLV